MEQIKHHRGDLYEQLARIGKLVMHPKRIALLDLLRQAERTVESLAEATGLELTTTSAHLQVMRQARLAGARREGTRMYYRASGEEVCRFIGALNELARTRLAEVDQILRAFGADASDTERVRREELLAFARVGNVVVPDVRARRSTLQATSLAYDRCHWRSSKRVSRSWARTPRWWPTVEAPSACWHPRPSRCHARAGEGPAVLRMGIRNGVKPACPRRWGGERQCMRCS